MAVPWLAVGNLVLNNLDKIIGVVKPGFTRKKVEVSSAQFDLINQQIAELQTAASGNAEQISQLATQLKDVVAALAQIGVLDLVELREHAVDFLDLHARARCNPATS